MVRDLEVKEDRRETQENKSIEIKVSSKESQSLKSQEEHKERAPPA